MTKYHKCKFWSRKILLNIFSKRFGIYFLRWQLSTPILAICVIAFANLGSVYATIIANAIGSLFFWWFDRFLFKKKTV